MSLVGVTSARSQVTGSWSDVLGWASWLPSGLIAVPAMIGGLFLKEREHGALRDDVQEMAAALTTLLGEEFGIECFVASGYRSQAAQDDLYAQGRTRPGPVVTWTRQSMHTEGRAVDIGFKGVHPDLISREALELIGAVGEAIGFKWGGRWRKPRRDPLHFEV